MMEAIGDRYADRYSTMDRNRRGGRHGVRQDDTVWIRRSRR